MNKLSKTCDRGHEYWGDLCDTCYPRTAHTPTPEVGKTMDDVKEFLRSRQILGIEKNQWIIRYPDGRNIDIVCLMSEWAALQCEAKDAEIKELREQIKRFKNPLEGFR